MKVAIVGGRDFNDYALVKDSVLEILKLSDISEIVSGGAKGADSLAVKFAKDHGIELVEFEADWKTYGRSAGPIRNKFIIERADIVFAFWDGKSKGTNSSINTAKRLNKKLKVVYYGNQDPQLF